MWMFFDPWNPPQHFSEKVKGLVNGSGPPQQDNAPLNAMKTTQEQEAVDFDLRGHQIPM